MRRIAIATAMACGALAIVPAIASAHNGTVAMTCSSVTYTYNNGSFADGGTTSVQTILETVTVDGRQVARATTTVNPLTSGTTVSTVPISVSGGSHTIVANAFDETTGKEVLVNALASGQSATNSTFPVTQTVSACPCQGGNGGNTWPPQGGCDRGCCGDKQGCCDRGCWGDKSGR